MYIDAKTQEKPEIEKALDWDGVMVRRSDGFIVRLRKHFADALGQAVEIQRMPQTKPSISGGMTSYLREKNIYEIQFGFRAPYLKWLPRVKREWEKVASLTIQDIHCYEQFDRNTPKTTKSRELSLVLTDAAGETIEKVKNLALPKSGHWPNGPIFDALKRQLDIKYPLPPMIL